MFITCEFPINRRIHRNTDTYIRLTEKSNICCFVCTSRRLLFKSRSKAVERKNLPNTLRSCSVVATSPIDSSKIFVLINLWVWISGIAANIKLVEFFKLSYDCSNCFIFLLISSLAVWISFTYKIYKFIKWYKYFLQKNNL